MKSKLPPLTLKALNSIPDKSNIWLHQIINGHCETDYERILDYLEKWQKLSTEILTEIELEKVK